MYTDSLYLAFAETYLEGCIRLEKKTESERLWSRDCIDSFTTDAYGNFSPRMCSDEHRKDDEREPGLSKEEIACTETLRICSKTYCCYDVASNKLKFSSEDLNKRVLEHNGEGPFDKYYPIMDGKTNITSANGCFCTNNHTVATYELIKKGLSLSYSKKIVQRDGTHTKPLNL